MKSNFSRSVHSEPPRTKTYDCLSFLGSILNSSPQPPRSLTSNEMGLFSRRKLGGQGLTFEALKRHDKAQRLKKRPRSLPSHYSGGRRDSMREKKRARVPISRCDSRAYTPSPSSSPPPALTATPGRRRSRGSQASSLPSNRPVSPLGPSSNRVGSEYESRNMRNSPTTDRRGSGITRTPHSDSALNSSPPLQHPERALLHDDFPLPIPQLLTPNQCRNFSSHSDLSVGPCPTLINSSSTHWPSSPHTSSPMIDPNPRIESPSNDSLSSHRRLIRGSSPDADIQDTNDSEVIVLENGRLGPARQDRWPTPPQARRLTPPRASFETAPPPSRTHVSEELMGDLADIGAELDSRPRPRRGPPRSTAANNNAGGNGNSR